MTQQDKGKIIGGDDKCVYSILHYLKEYADRSREEGMFKLTQLKSTSARSIPGVIPDLLGPCWNFLSW